ncbi:MAG TPA: Flp pilus assembly protein CpaB [Candidatus Dormibacteraeota bacterium]
MSAELARPRPAPPPSGSRNRRLPLLAGLTLAAVAFLGVFALGTQGGKSAQVTTTVIVVAARDIQAREVLSPDMMTTAAIPTSAVPPGAVIHPTDLKGQTMLVSALKGQPLTTNLVATSPDAALGQGVAYLPIPAGFVALAIPTGELQGVAGYVSPGDYLNVLVTVGTQPFGDARNIQVTKLAFKNLHVIRVGPGTPGKAGQVQGVSGSLTVLMTVCDAEMFLELENLAAKLTYVLLSYKDYISPPIAPDPACPTAYPTSGVTAAQVNARYGFTSP